MACICIAHRVARQLTISVLISLIMESVRFCAFASFRLYRLFGPFADVTMVQRSSTYIMTNKEGWPILMKGKHSLGIAISLSSLTDRINLAGTYWEGGPPVEMCDLIDLSLPILYRKMIHKRITLDIAKADKYVHIYFRRVSVELTDCPAMQGHHRRPAQGRLQDQPGP